MTPVNKIKEICFSQDTKERKQWFTGMSFSHPAKMHLSLQIYLLEHYTKKGETILDPMSGSGTILFACTLGRNVVCVELEAKFVKMQEGNWQKIKGIGPMLGYKMGEAVILQGDARDLEGLFADKIVFSPPYALSDARNPSKGVAKEKSWSAWNIKQDDSSHNIGNLPYGSVDKVINQKKSQKSIDTGNKLCYDEDYGKKHRNKKANRSPQSGNREAISGKGDVSGEAGSTTGMQSISGIENIQGIGDKSQKQRSQGERALRLQERDGQSLVQEVHQEGKVRAMQKDRKFGNTSQGLKSPKQQPRQLDGSLCELSSQPTQKDVVGSQEEGRALQKHGSDRLEQMDCICTSPPYEQAQEGGGLCKNPPKAMLTPGRKKCWHLQGYQQSGSQDNIGNLKSANYLDAMFLVYRQCHLVLRDEGLLILVTKNFIRDKKLVRLDLDTIKLCEKSGFVLKERLKRKLTQQSFWRTIYYKKFPDAPRIDYEDVLVFVKSRAETRAERIV